MPEPERQLAESECDTDGYSAFWNWLGEKNKAANYNSLNVIKMTYFSEVKTHLSLVTHICVSDWAIIGLHYCLSHDRRQAII